MLDIEIHHQTSRAVIAGVRRGEFDAGMALCVRPPEDLQALRLERLRYRIVAPAAWADRLREVDWNAVAALPWISTPADGSHFHMALNIFEQYGFRPLKVMEADSEAIITSLVFAGVGLGLMREDLAAEAECAGRAFVLPRGEAEASLMLLHGKAQTRDPAVDALIAAMRDVWTSATDGQSLAR
jgi:DNA-binding transcriptional LysR family regulator